jgi:hypothetical protein
VNVQQHTVDFLENEEWIAWPVSWSAIWVGALAAFAAVAIIGLAGTAAGIGALANVKDFSDWKSLSLIDTVVAIFGAFLAFVIGGWVTGKIAGIRRAEPAILHAAISWLVALPILLAFIAAGMGKTFGGWYGGLAGSSPIAAAAIAAPSPETIRHFAIASVTAVLLGLMGAVVGGWMACGEPMSITHHKKRTSATRRVTGG